MQEYKYMKRLRNQPSSEASKARGHPPAVKAIISTGDIVHVKNEGTKHTARSFYLVTSVNYETGEAYIQKYCGDQLRAKRYLVKLEEIYSASTNFIPVHDRSSNNKEDIPLNSDVSIGSEENDLGTTELRRSSRERRAPDWLSTPEIQRSEHTDY